MAEVMAGFVCGFGLSLIATPVAAVAILRARVTSPLAAQMVPKGTSTVAVSLVIHMFAFVTLTAIGLLLGLLLYGIESERPAGGLGSPNWLFTAIILGITAIGFGPPLALVSRWRRPLLFSALLFLATFGWAMPYLSLLGPERG